MINADSIPAPMRRTVLWTSIGLGGEGLFTAFAAHVDVPVIAAAWAGMFVRLALQAELDLDRESALKIATGVLVGIGGIATGVKLANTWLSYTGVGTIPAMLCNGATNGAVTYMIGIAASRVFVTQGHDLCVEECIRAIIRIVRPGHHH